MALAWLAGMLTLLEVEILPRSVRRRGVAFALSALACYTLVTAGLLLALAAMGIDLTKVTVIAGALGVRIGFGLKSVVNNLLTGLILRVGRPVTAGDVVQIGDTQGVVVGIGARSTTVRTPAGAEVIVRNADPITKLVSDWTLSDNRCRIEIEFNVPSASTRTNGKAARFLQTSLREWACARPYISSAQRAAALQPFLHRHNWHRPHCALNRQLPMSRIPAMNDL